MRNIILILSTFLYSFSISASDITSISLGSCWVQKRAETVKYASFNEGLSTSLHKDQLYRSLFKTVSDKNIKSIDVSMHCSSVAKIVLNIARSDSNTCIWGTYHRGELIIEGEYLSETEEGYCSGIVSNKLIFATVEGFSEFDLISNLDSREIKYRELTKTGDNTYTITLDEGLDLYDVEKEISSIDLVKYVDLIYLERHIGEVLNLENLDI